MLFSNISTLLEKGITLQFVCAAVQGDKIEVTVLPSTQNGAAGAGLVAKTVVATPQELDDQFADFMKGYASTNATLQDALVDVQARAKEAEEAARADAAEKTKARTTSTSKSTPKSVAKATDSMLPEGDGEGDGDGDGPDLMDLGSTVASDTTSAGGQAEPFLL